MSRSRSAWQTGALIGLAALLLAALLTAGVVPAPAGAQEAGVSDSRFAHLARGTNLTGWFWYGPDNLGAMDSYFTADDFATIRGLGFTFVRVPIDLEVLLDRSQPDLLNPDRLAVLDHALDGILAADLAVIVDLHSTSLADSDAAVYSAALEGDPAFVDLFAAFWKSLAAHLSVRDPEYVFIEPMNEPVFQDDPQAWLPIQERLIAVIRASAPQHTLIATSALWSGLDTFLRLTPVSDPNVVYNFHYYEPFIFTHQGAAWTWFAVIGLSDVPYPSSPEAVQPVLKRVGDPTVAGFIRDYGEER